MSNYTKENLIAIPPTAVPAGTLAMKVGNEIFTPGNIRISAGGMDFYKCASVDTTNKTWTGYLAVLTDGVYTFEETATAGLSYGTAYTPVYDSIYSADATVIVSKIWDGDPPFALWHGDSLTDTKAGLVFTAVDGASISDADSKFPSIGKSFALPGSDSAGFKVTLPQTADLSDDFTVDFWAKITGSADNMGLFRIGGWSNNVCAIFATNGGIIYAHPGSLSGGVSMPQGTWNHYAIERFNGRFFLYLDGELLVSNDSSIDYTGKELSINASDVGFSPPFEGFVQEFRLSTTAKYAGKSFTPPSEPYK